MPIFAPVLQTWKTKAGYSILGFICPVLLAIVLAVLKAILEDLPNALSPEFLYLTTLIGLYACLTIYLVLSLVYSLKVYPSLFTEKPLLKSSEAISFLNGCVAAFALPLWLSGIAFCLLWNYNLTRQKKGISHVVFAITIAASCVVFALFLAGLYFGSASPE